MNDCLELQCSEFKDRFIADGGRGFDGEVKQRIAIDKATQLSERCAGVAGCILEQQIDLKGAVKRMVEARQNA